MNRIVCVLFLCTTAVLSLSSCRKTPEQRAASFIAKGKNLLAQKQYGAANLEFLNASQLRPNDPEALHLVAMVAIANADYARAIGYLRKALDKNPGYGPSRTQLADIMAASPYKSHVTEAVGEAQSVLKNAPTDAEALRVLARAKLKLGDYAGAEEHFIKSLSLMPRNLQASINLAVLKWQKNDLAGAEDDLKRAVASTPKSPEPLLVLGRFYRLTKRTQEAETTLRRSAQLDPSSGLALDDLAQLYASQNRDGEVEATYRALAKLPEPRFKTVHAVYLFGRGRQTEAVAELKALAEADKSDREIRSLLVSAYVLTNQQQLAAKVLSDTLTRNPKDASALLERSRLYLSEGKVEEVERDMRTVIQLNATSADGHYLLAQALRKSKKHTARQELSEALTLDPRMLSARVELCVFFRESGEFQAAQDLIAKAPNDQKTSRQLIIEQNWIWLATGEHTRLRKSLDELQKPVQDPTLLVQDALLRNQQKDYAGAIQQAEAALHINPRDLRAIDAVASAFVAQKQPSGAIAKVRQYADAQPQSAQLRYYLATWLLKTDRKEEARQALTKAIELDGNFAPARLTMAQLELKDRQYDAASKQVETILQRDPRDGSALLLSAVIVEGSRNFELAIEAYRKVLAVDDTNPLAMNNLAYLLAEHTENLDQAQKYAEKAKEISPESADVDDTLGWIYFRRGRYDAAVRHLQMADKRRPAAVTKYHLAMAYHRTGARDLARQALWAGNKMDPTLAEAKAAAALLVR